MRFPLLFLLFSCALLHIACEKKITLKHPAHSPPRMIIEALLSDSMGEGSIKLTQSTDMNSQATAPVHNALVTITEDQTNKIDTFREQDHTGIYRNPKAKAQAAHSYFLSVNAGGKIYEGRNHMPLSQVDLSSIDIVPVPPSINRIILSSQPNANNISLLVQLNKEQNTPAQVAINVLHKNSIATTQLYELQASDHNIRRIINIYNISLAPQDSLVVNLQSITPELYEILLSIQNNTRQTKAVPTNPLTNLTNGALGYFEIYHSKARTIRK